MVDPITDMLNQIRNAQAVEKAEVSVPFSQLKQSIAEILAEEGFIGAIKKSLKKESRTLKINLKYKEGAPVIVGLKRISKSGQRIYVKSSEIKAVRGGRGFSIISTPKGLMTNRKARQEKLGGEVICEIW
ncbi:30S ribosomal protein S8 [Patescibacteria group bacterium]|nr:30S ribosomal protein S8 [Patescibacteria group bacterium]